MRDDFLLLSVNHQTSTRQMKCVEKIMAVSPTLRSVNSEETDALLTRRFNAFEDYSPPNISFEEALPLNRTSTAELVRQGQCKLRVLQTNHEQAVDEARAHLSTTNRVFLAAMERTFREMEVNLEKRDQDIQQALRQRENRLAQVQADPSMLLSPEEEVFCTSEPRPLFHLAIGDARMQAVQLLMTNSCLLPLDGSVPLDASEQEKAAAELKTWVQEQQEGNAIIAKSALEFCNALGAHSELDLRPALQAQLEKTARTQIMLLPTTATEQDILDLADEYIRKGKVSREAGNLNQSLRQLQKASALLHQKDLPNKDLQRDLDLTLVQFTRQEPSSELLKRVLGKKSAHARPATQTLLLRNRVAEAYHQVGRWEETVRVELATLEEWGSSGSSFELFRALFFLINASERLSNLDSCLVQARKWTSQLEVHEKLSRAAFLCVWAAVLQQEGQTEEAAQHYETAMEGLPHSYFSVVTETARTDLPDIDEARRGGEVLLSC